MSSLARRLMADRIAPFVTGSTPLTTNCKDPGTTDTISVPAPLMTETTNVAKAMSAMSAGMNQTACPHR